MDPVELLLIELLDLRWVLDLLPRLPLHEELVLLLLQLIHFGSYLFKIDIEIIFLINLVRRILLHIFNIGGDLGQLLLEGLGSHHVHGAGTEVIEKAALTA